MNILILHGEILPDAGTDEQDTLLEVEAVRQTVEELGCKATVLPVTTDLSRLITTVQESNYSAVFYLVEAIQGVGRYIHLPATILDQLQMPYTGGNAEALFATSMKLFAKQILKGAALPTPAWLTAAAAKKNPGEMVFPCIIKHGTEHASIGLSANSIAVNATDLRKKLDQLSSSEIDQYFVEQFIDGREFNLSVMAMPDGPVVFPCAEILFEDFGPDRYRIVDYKAKWEEGSFEYTHTPRTFDFAPTDTPLLETLRELSLKAWHAFNLTGYARVDFRVSADNEPYILEINANPCITPEGGFASAAEQAGLPYKQMVAAILNDALRRSRQPEIKS